MVYNVNLEKCLITTPIGPCMVYTKRDTSKLSNP